MASGRTVSAKELTERDKMALDMCRNIGEALEHLIADEQRRKDFRDNYGRIHSSRDAGLGRAGGKLQRDALCTRGRTDKAPFSNRNLRWHPLITAQVTPSYAIEVEEILIDNKLLVFVIDGDFWYPQDVYGLSKICCATLDKWYPLRDELVQWTDDDWSKNACVIPALEHSTLEYSLEIFATLGIAVACNFYDVDVLAAYDVVMSVFERQAYTVSSEYPGPDAINKLVRCPLCLAPLNKSPAALASSSREGVFQPPWRSSKREEGEAESLQLFHIVPLKEATICHVPGLVAYGHRWCNVAMTDHSIDETLDFMRAVVEAHERENGQV